MKKFILQKKILAAAILISTASTIMAGCYYDDHDRWDRPNGYYGRYDDRYGYYNRDDYYGRRDYDRDNWWRGRDWRDRDRQAPSWHNNDD